MDGTPPITLALARPQGRPAGAGAGRRDRRRRSAAPVGEASRSCSDVEHASPAGGQPGRRPGLSTTWPTRSGLPRTVLASGISRPPPCWPRPCAGVEARHRGALIGLAAGALAQALRLRHQPDRLRRADQQLPGRFRNPLVNVSMAITGASPAVSTGGLVRRPRARRAAWAYPHGLPGGRGGGHVHPVGTHVQGFGFTLESDMHLFFSGPRAGCWSPATAVSSTRSPRPSSAPSPPEETHGLQHPDPDAESVALARCSTSRRAPHRGGARSTTGRRATSTTPASQALGRAAGSTRRASRRRALTQLAQILNEESPTPTAPR